jgi:hypothetical protein
MAQPQTLSPLDRLLASFRAFVEATLAQLRYLGTYEYSVVASGPNTVDVTPVDPGIGLPAMTKVPLRSGLLGQTVTASPGSLATIRFVNGDPSRPICTGLLGTPISWAVDASGQVNVGPSAVKIAFAGGSLGIARVGDSVTIFFPPGCYVTGTLTLGGSVVPIASLSIVNGLGGFISLGSPNVVTE